MIKNRDLWRIVQVLHAYMKSTLEVWRSGVNKPGKLYNRDVWDIEQQDLIDTSTPCFRLNREVIAQLSQSKFAIQRTMFHDNLVDVEEAIEECIQLVEYALDDREMASFDLMADVRETGTYRRWLNAPLAFIHAVFTAFYLIEYADSIYDSPFTSAQARLIRLFTLLHEHNCSDESKGAGVWLLYVRGAFYSLALIQRDVSPCMFELARQLDAITKNLELPDYVLFDPIGTCGLVEQSTIHNTESMNESDVHLKAGLVDERLWARTVFEFYRNQPVMMAPPSLSSNVVESIMRFANVFSYTQMPSFGPTYKTAQKWYIGPKCETAVTYYAGKVCVTRGNYSVVLNQTNNHDRYSWFDYTVCEIGHERKGGIRKSHNPIQPLFRWNVPDRYNTSTRILEVLDECPIMRKFLVLLVGSEDRLNRQLQTVIEQYRIDGYVDTYKRSVE